MTTFKFTQETFDPTHDNVELMICNYYDSEVEPTPNISNDIITSTATITYNGTKPTIKVGGSYKILTPSFSDKTVTVDKWVVSDEKGDISSGEKYTIEQDGDKLQLKALKYDLIGTVLTVKLIGSDGSTTKLLLEVV